MGLRGVVPRGEEETLALRCTQRVGKRVHRTKHEALCVQRESVGDELTIAPLGTRIAARFAGLGFPAELPELSGQGVDAPAFAATGPSARRRSGVDLIRRIGDFEIQIFRRLEQTLGMLLQFENRAAIDALALKYAVGVMQRMRQHMHFGLAPGNKFAIEPDHAVAIIKGSCKGHRHISAI